MQNVLKSLPRILNVMLFLLVCASSAYWLPRLWRAPEKNVLPGQVVAAWEGKALIGDVFGSVARVEASGACALQGVIYAFSEPERAAVVSCTGQKAQSVRVGQTLSAGRVLRSVERDHVVLDEQGVMRHLAIPEKPQLTIALPQKAVPVPPPSPEKKGRAEPAPPMVVPGLPVASLPAAMPGSP